MDRLFLGHARASSSGERRTVTTPSGAGEDARRRSGRKVTSAKQGFGGLNATRTAPAVAWAARLRSIVDPPSANVVELTRAEAQSVAATVQSLDEKRALDSAVEYFRICGDDLTVKGSNAFLDSPQYLSYVRDRDDALAVMAEAASRGYGRAVHSACHVAAELIERGEQLPESLRMFTVGFLRGKIKTKRKPGPDRFSLGLRNEHIVAALEYITKTWKFSPTRNPGRTGRDPSAASIVREALIIGANINLSEAAINTIWNQRHPRANG